MASRTDGEYSVGDLISEAWLLSEEIGRKRGRAFDFSDETDQDTLMAWLHREVVTYQFKVNRNAVRLDLNWDGGEDKGGQESSLARFLVAPREADPELARAIREEDFDFLEMARGRYSEATAYVLLLASVEWELDDLAELLWIGVRTLRKRLAHAAAVFCVQPSIFDGLAVLSLEELLTAAGQYRSRRQRLVPKLPERFC